MKTVIFGAAGFIGTNLAIRLAENKRNRITLVDANKTYFGHMVEYIDQYKQSICGIVEADFSENTDFDALLKGQEVVYHLVSTNAPGTSNSQIPQELSANVIVTSRMLDACARCGVKKVIFISSGGTVYGKEAICPLNEESETNPISSYGIQKLTIEKLLYLYHYLHGFDYRIIRLANPYGPYQRPNGKLGAVTTFTYKALNGEKITVFGDGSTVRDFIYIDDAVNGICNIVGGENCYKVFNLGCGYGTSIKQLLDTIGVVLGCRIDVEYIEGRKADVPTNYLDISRYEAAYGKLNPIPLCQGVRKTAEFIRSYYKI